MGIFARVCVFFCEASAVFSDLTPRAGFWPKPVSIGNLSCMTARYMILTLALSKSNVATDTMEKIPMTHEGYTALNAELKNLKSVERPAIIRAVAEAREHGDLSENAEYHSAREKHSFIEGRIKELEAIVSLAEVIDPSTLSGTIKFGAKVTLVDEDTDEEKTYQVVGEPEANIEAGKLNIKSPLARALIGKDEGDSVEVRTPGGVRSYEILTIKFV